MVFDPFDEGWNYRKQVTIDYSQVDGDLSNFPVLINVMDSDLRGKAQDDGDDILFMDGTGGATRLYHEIETFVGATGELLAWVNLPLLSDEEDTVFYMYYGNQESDNQQCSEVVWDEHFVGIWHLTDKTDLTVGDSTINGFDGTKKGVNAPLEENGKIGRCQLFHKANLEYISMGDLSELEFQGDFTISGWCHPFSDEGMKISGKHHEESGAYSGYAINWKIGTPTPKKISLRVDGGGWAYEYIRADEPGPPNQWYYVVGLKRAGVNYLYVDGVQQTQTGTQTLANTDDDFYIGTSTNGDKANFDGWIDEVRTSDVGRNSEWISTEYTNQNDPSGFCSFGPEEPGP
jgi:MSHA biogenesis protein MshQ